MSEVRSFPKLHQERLKGDPYREFIRSIFERDSWRCRCCREKRSLTPHHLRKRSQLGGDTPGNVITLCMKCHDEVEQNKLRIEIIDTVLKFYEREEAKDEEAEKFKDESSGIPA